MAGHGVALALLNVPGAAIWAILAFVTNFVPNIGFVLGVIPPAILAFFVVGMILLLPLKEPSDTAETE